MAALEKRSREFACPFCPPLIDQVTARFPADIVPEGVIRRGKATVFPNIQPYDIYGVVVVMTDKHFVTLKDLDAETVQNALMAGQSFLQIAQKTDQSVKYHFIAWNYMPPSGGSLVHPHIQCNAGYHPTDYQKQLQDASEKYFRARGTNYWSDLLVQEKKAGERYIGKSGNTEWLTEFSPRGRIADILAFFPGKASILELTESDWRDFVNGLLKVFSYIDGLRLISFNLSTYSGQDNKRFWAHIRIAPRGMLLYSPIETSDQFYYQTMQDESVCIIPPETVAAELRKLFK
jgi:galactose-1-phosphate uridylyltransferase